MASRSASRTVIGLVGPQSLSGSAAAAATTGAGAAGGAALASCGGGAAAGGGDALAAGGAGALPTAEADTSSPFTASTAIGVLTGTPSVPSGTRICASFPSSTASTSMVALSVSISAITSPA